MKKVGLVALAGGVLLGATLLIACNGSDQPVDDTGTVEVGVPCYTKDGKFVKWDDDCHDDGLVVGPPPARKTSGGMKTAGQVKPSPKTSRR